MVERLCSDYGTEIPITMQTNAVTAAEGAGAGAGAGQSFYAFPTLEQLSKATDEGLRAAGFGYRAKYICAATAFLQQKDVEQPGWLLGLRCVSVCPVLSPFGPPLHH